MLSLLDLSFMEYMAVLFITVLSVIVYVCLLWDKARNAEYEQADRDGRTMAYVDAENTKPFVPDITTETRAELLEKIK
jgi:hypothetical protein